MTAAATFVLLAIGQLVTSFQAGMADPIWPTEPWYLFVIGWQEPSRGYLIEHTHRIVAFFVGGLVSVLALGLWWFHPDRTSRWLSLGSILILLGGFGQFHGGLIAQRNVPPADVRLPLGGTIVTLIGLSGLIVMAVLGLVSRSRGSTLRFLGALALIGVMIQGLFGGFRVLLNELVGTDLATIHGIFAQVVFSLLVSIAILTGKAGLGAARTDDSVKLRRGTNAHVILLFVQIVLGAFVRHSPSPLTQRLHFLTAFIATGLLMWVVMSVCSRSEFRSRAGFWIWLVMSLLVVQIVLGVEAWLEKFGSYTLPELVPITTQFAAIRTAHALVGSGLLASALAIALRLGMPSGPYVTTSTLIAHGRTDPPIRETRTAVAAHIRGSTP